MDEEVGGAKLSVSGIQQVVDGHQLYLARLINLIHSPLIGTVEIKAKRVKVKTLVEWVWLRVVVLRHLISNYNYTAILN